ncbi:MAG: UDP-N-acetylglucosamine diphosphorylase/glucosamine-1-phosphate N-acetyltransferase [Bacillaceae bacterium G1]|nr:bifunctional UDP-N-acetylglucosamine diphosphorylase/glucosamine-1-phosphate N-acetyltransferase GlmU [Bacillota bacterium]OJF16570.1 MAG: UDP-N-acetylglucosamine diphosphorylase/glucosamine-1-phosphate N-acetyltransferase [Bacillaceae bacterium G1]
MRRYGVVLAAGKGTRMRSKMYKVMHPLCGKPMVEHVVDELTRLRLDMLVTVVGCGADAVRECLGDRSQYAFQEEQLGTAHAVLQAAPLLADKEGTTLVVCGDTPLLRAETLRRLLETHEQHRAAATVLTAELADPTGYGRIVREADGRLKQIVEHKDATGEQLAIREVNTGIYCFDNRWLFQLLPKVTNDNAQGEYYLPDVIGLLLAAGQPVYTVAAEDADEILGINDRVALAAAERIMRRRIHTRHQQNGVTIVDPDNTYIDADVIIGPDTVIYPGTLLRGRTVIGADCTIGPAAHLQDVQVGDRVHIWHSVLMDAVILEDSSVGPFAYVRPGSHVGPRAKVGDFVELKNTRFGAGSKASHLAYLGDADVGANVNIGCGTITVNFDGVHKHRTIIEDDVFVGCNANLVAPVRIGRGAYVAAGSTVTEDVPPDSLAIARQRQINKEGYVPQLRAKRQAMNPSADN